MSKGLDALKRIRQETCPATIIPDFDKEECCKIIEKELKALEIMKDTLGIFLYETTEDNKLGETHYYIDIAHCCSYQIAKEQYDLLKEVLL